MLPWILLAIVLPALILTVARAIALDAYRVASASMMPTLVIGDLVLVLKRRCVSDIKVGDLVVFVQAPGAAPTTGALIKRVAATDDDAVSARLPKGSLFVLGDRLDASHDSRHFGPIRDTDVAGRAIAVLWPMHRIRLLR